MQMAPLLDRKTSVRPRLILACLTVSLLIAAIYVTVSYRLTADVSIETELNAMQRVVRLLNNELLRRDGSFSSKTDAFSRLLITPEDQAPKVFQVTSQTNQWKQAHLLSSEEMDSLLLTFENQRSQDNHLIAHDGNTYLWYQKKSDGYTITFIQQTVVLDTTLSLVAKRLVITSIIVFWIAVWLALTLSSLIAKRAEEINDALTELATTDALTGLPNRLYLTDTLSTALCTLGGQSAVNEGCLFAIDLDKFKEVNDSFGHTAGDELLKSVAQRISAITEAPYEVIRIGGDEFIIWAPGCSVEEGKRIAQKVVESCDIPILINGLEINTGASVGFAHFPTHTDNSETLISCADTAMYKAKEQRSGWQLYDAQKVANHKQDLQLRAEINDAMLNNQLILHFQPKVNIQTGHIVSVEGLCRWEHPQLGLLMPYAFIELIEHSGKVQEFGRYIIKKAVEHVSMWRQEGIYTPIAVNLSPYNLLDPGLDSYIKGLLHDFDVPAECIELELTENETCLNIKYIQGALDKVRHLGVKLAIDDFGTGMSSLAYLANLQVNVLKIDRTFINDIETNSGHRAIVASTVTLAESFGCELVAEGVETQSQAAILTSMGCKLAQGYLFAKPMPENEIKTLLINGELLGQPPSRHAV
jgi:diguanylate cyclase (GGDEF)-like protein